VKEGQLEKLVEFYCYAAKLSLFEHRNVSEFKGLGIPTRNVMAKIVYSLLMPAYGAEKHLYNSPVTTK